MTITAPDEAIIFGIKKDLERIFKMKDLSEIHWLLNLKIERDMKNKTLSISQSTYIDKILCWFNLQDAKISTTPLDPNLKLFKDQSPITEPEKEDMKKIPYGQAIDSLTYVDCSCHPA